MSQSTRHVMIAGHDEDISCLWMMNDGSPVEGPDDNWTMPQEAQHYDIWEYC